MSVQSAITRVVFIVALGFITFWPDIGLLWIAVNNMQQHYLIVSAGIALWAIVVSLILPLTIKQFKLASSVAILVIFACGFYLSWMSGFAFIPWWAWLIVVGGCMLGWWMVSTPLWRWARGIAPVAPVHHDRPGDMHDNPAHHGDF